MTRVRGGRKQKKGQFHPQSLIDLLAAGVISDDADEEREGDEVQFDDEMDDDDTAQ